MTQVPAECEECGYRTTVSLLVGGDVAQVRARLVHDRSADDPTRYLEMVASHTVKVTVTAS